MPAGQYVRIYNSLLTRALQLFKPAHTIIGTIVVCCLVIQPLMGILHHRHYVRHKKRGPISYAHIWWGRALNLLGVINGGLGLQLANASNTLIIAYSVIAAVIFLLYAIIKVWSSTRVSKGVGGRRAKQETGSSSSPWSATGPGTPPQYQNGRLTTYV